jgi:hypothetical protein
MPIAERDLNLPEILMVPDIAHYLRISRSAAYELAHVPGFPALIMSRKIRIRRESFLSWLNEQENMKVRVNY